MNYYQPRQRKTDSRWDYTCRNDDRIWPVGYCAPYKEYSKEFLERYHFSENDPGMVKHREFKDKYHSDGHATPEECYSCYKEYLLDHHLYFDISHPDEQRKCVECGTWTMNAAQIRHSTLLELCEYHMNRETVSKHFQVGDIISSY